MYNRVNVGIDNGWISIQVISITIRLKSIYGD